MMRLKKIHLYINYIKTKKNHVLNSLLYLENSTPFNFLQAFFQVLAICLIPGTKENPVSNSEQVCSQCAALLPGLLFLSASKVPPAVISNYPVNVYYIHMKQEMRGQYFPTNTELKQGQMKQLPFDHTGR